MKTFCVCAFFASISCDMDECGSGKLQSVLRMDIELINRNPCDPLKMPNGSLAMPFKHDAWSTGGTGCDCGSGDCGGGGRVCSCKLPANTGDDPSSHIHGDSYYRISVFDVKTGQMIFGPAEIVLDADGDYPTVCGGCVDITELLASC